MNRLISVVVPVYNVEDVLHFCIDSILNQTYSDFELLLVDDGSTDKSGDICDQYARKDTRIRVFHKENGGVSSARNLGIDNANGEYICFIDSDDYLDRFFLEELIKEKNLFPGFDSVWCGFQTVNGYKNHEVLEKIVFEKNNKVTKTSVKEIMTLHDKWLDAGPCCKLYRRDLIISSNLRFLENISLGEDLYFNFKYLDLTNGKIIVVNKCLYNYVKTNNESLTNKFHKNLFEKYRFIHRLMYECLVKWKCEKEQFLLYYNSCFFIYEFVLQNTFREDSTIEQKYKYNRRIITSYEFKNAIRNSNCYIHPIYKLGYMLGSYRIIRLFDILLDLRK